MAREGQGYANPLDFLIRQTKLTSTHLDYLRTGQVAASLTLSGDSALVRELLDRIAELSEDGQRERQAKHTANEGV